MSKKNRSLLDDGGPKTICFTIDIEPDFGGLLSRDTYYGLRNLSKLADIIHNYDLKITAFVTGKTLEDNPGVIDELKSINAEVEQHSYLHLVGRGSPKVDDIEKGIEIHRKMIGRSPLGYRAPQGIINLREVQILKSLGVMYDSSIFPAFFPGRFNKLSFPQRPFIYDEIDILEIPISVLPQIRIPFGLSYMQLLGWNTFRLLGKLFGYPRLIIYDFHSYELGKTFSYSKLPLIEKMGYFRSQKLYGDPISVFEKFVTHILSEGYTSRYMIDVYHMNKDTAKRFLYK